MIAKLVADGVDTPACTLASRPLPPAPPGRGTALRRAAAARTGLSTNARDLAARRAAVATGLHRTPWLNLPTAGQPPPPSADTAASWPASHGPVAGHSPASYDWPPKTHPEGVKGAGQPDAEES